MKIYCYIMLAAESFQAQSKIHYECLRSRLIWVCVNFK